MTTETAHLAILCDWQLSTGLRASEVIELHRECDNASPEDILRDYMAIRNATFVRPENPSKLRTFLKFFFPYFLR